MIVDRLDHFGLYLLSEEKYVVSCNFLKSLSVFPREEGKYILLGDDDVYASVFSYKTSPSSELRFEQHRRYIDLHYIISGEEVIEWTNSSDSSSGEYNPEDDVSFFGSALPNTSSIHMVPGMFMLLHPDDLHKPKCNLASSKEVKKVVVKVKI